MERETGIEPVSLAWKAKVLPLNYSRPGSRRGPATTLENSLSNWIRPGGGGWIRTSVGVSQQIYSLPPLATRAPLRRTSKYSMFWAGPFRPTLSKHPREAPLGQPAARLHEVPAPEERHRRSARRERRGVVGLHRVLQSNHPSPLSAARPPLPFIGCGHFSAANQFLTASGYGAIDWQLP